MNVLLCQFDIAWENRQANFSRVEELLGSRPVEPGSLVVLPEMFSTGFSMNTAATQEASPSLTEKFLQDLAKKLNVNILAGVVGLHAGKPHNDAILVTSDGLIRSRYSKINPFTLGGETANYGAGSETVIFNLNGFRVAPFICYDLRFPEVFRKAASKGCDLICVIANWPCAREQHWVTLLQARAIENQSYVVGVNRVGTDPKLEYPGRSMVIAPSGEILVDAGRSEGIVEFTLNLSEVTSYRERLPFLKDMKP